MPASMQGAVAETQAYVQMFEEAEHSTYDARQYSERDRDYYDGIQLTQEEIEALQKRGQPPIVINRIRRKVDYIKGLEAQRRTDPKAFPRTPQHQQGAEAATDAIRFVADLNNWHDIRSAVFEDMMIEGFGGCEVIEEGGEIRINYYGWDRLFYDPHSRRKDFMDARYKGAVIWMDAEEVKAAYPDAANGVDLTVDSSSTDETYDDRPKYDLWGDSRRNRVRVVLLYYRENEVWKWVKFVKGAVLEEGESTYVDSKGKSVCPLLLQAMYVNRENERYGIVRDMIHPQDEINKRRSKALHMLTMRQVIMEKGDLNSTSAMRAELARPDGVIEVMPDQRFDILPNGDLAAGQASLLQEAKNEIDLMGANSALSGDTGESQSGRAVLARQQGGLTELMATFDPLHMLTKRVYEAIWDRVRQFWTEERWIRVTDDDRNVRFVGLNRPVTVGEMLVQMPEEQAVAAARQMGLQMNDPRVGMVAEIENPVEEIDVDIEIEEVPEQVSMDAEQFQALAALGPALVQANPVYAPVFAELMIDTAPGLRTNTKDKLRQSIEQAQQLSGPMQQAQAQMEMAGKKLELGQAQADIEATMAKAKRDEVEAARGYYGALA